MVDECDVIEFGLKYIKRYDFVNKKSKKKLFTNVNQHAIQIQLVLTCFSVIIDFDGFYP